MPSTPPFFSPPIKASAVTLVLELDAAQTVSLDGCVSLVVLIRLPYCTENRLPRSWASLKPIGVAISISAVELSTGDVQSERKESGL